MGILLVALCLPCCALLFPAASSSAWGVLPPVLPSLPVFPAASSGASNPAVVGSSGVAPTSVSPLSSSLIDSIASSSSAGDSVMSWVLQSLLPKAASGSSDRVLVGSGLPSIPRKLLAKIRNWEFVELSELLPASSPTEASTSSGVPAARFSLFPGCEIVSHKKKQIADIAGWTQAFAVYTAALVSEHPSATLEMLAYMVTIIKASQQYDGLYWRAYDTNYRLTAAASGNRQWSRLDTDLFTRFFTGRARLVSPCSTCDSIAHSAADCPFGQLGKRPKGGDSRSGFSQDAGGQKRRKFGRNWPASVCADFNAKGSCSFGSRCKYRHSCAECSGDHPVKFCPSSGSKA